MGQALCEGVPSFAPLPYHSSWPTPCDQPMSWGHRPGGGKELLNCCWHSAGRERRPPSNVRNSRWRQHGPLGGWGRCDLHGAPACGASPSRGLRMLGEDHMAVNRGGTGCGHRAVGKDRLWVGSWTPPSLYSTPWTGLPPAVGEGSERVSEQFRVIQLSHRWILLMRPGFRGGPLPWRLSVLACLDTLLGPWKRRLEGAATSASLEDRCEGSATRNLPASGSGAQAWLFSRWSFLVNTPVQRQLPSL